MVYDTSQPGKIIRTDDDGVVSYIPCDPLNVDYQQYLIDTGGEP